MQNLDHEQSMLARARRFVRVYGIAALALLALIVIARSSLDPELYFRYDLDKPAKPVSNPTGVVAFVTAVLFTEAAVLYLLLRPWRPGWPWKRALAALLIFTGWLWLCTFLVVHAPGYVLLHAMWIFAVVAALAINLLGSIIWSLRRHYRREPASPQAKAAG